MTGLPVEWMVFDLGETLVDENRAWAQLARERGISPLTLAAALGAVIERGERHHAIWPRLGLEPPTGAWLRLRAEDVYPDALPCLRALRAAGLRLGVAGNQPEWMHHWVVEQGWPVDFVTSSWEIGATKPDPAFFAAVARRAGVPAERIAYVGDRVDNDVAPARAAGMRAVFLVRGPWGTLQRDRPQAQLAELTIHGLDELVAALAPPPAR